MSVRSVNTQGIDYLLLGMAMALMSFGLIMVLSASGIMAERFYDDKYHFFIRQCLFAFLGVGVMGLAATAPLDRIISMKYLWLGLVILLLILTMFSPLGATVNGARRWLRFGPLTIQPMELAKVALVIYLAWFFSRKKHLVRTFSVGVVPPFAVTGLLCGLILIQPDFGGAAALAILLFFMCLVCGTRFIYLVFSLAMGLGAAWSLILQSPYRLRRMMAFMDPFEDALDSGYQLVQSLYALGMGGAWGVGLGAGKQKLFFLPEAHNDFIIAVVGEELGFMGVSLVFVLMGLLIWRGFAVALRQEDLARRFLAYGLTMILCMGALLNMAVVLGTAPPKGVPMPFLSYGGSSLLTSFLCVGLLLNISRQEGRT